MPDPEYHDAAHEWYEQGDRDRRMARLLLSADPPELGGVAFHGQQAVKKYFKAILTLHREEPPYTHDLGELLDQIEQYEEEFGAFRSAAEKMSPFAVAVRYPNPENVPTEEKARGLAEQWIRFVPRYGTVCFLKNDGTPTLQGVGSYNHTLERMRMRRVPIP